MIVLYILLAVVILLFMILVHEFGHYIAGKILKFKITEFSIGFGPAIFSRTSKKTGEKFSVRCIPLGGYCAFDGEEDSEEGASETSFNKQKPWKRIIVFVAGVTANFITAILFSWILLSTIGYDVPQVTRDITYHQNILYEGDIITHVNGKEIDFAFGENYVPLVNGERSKAIAYYKQNGIETETKYSFEMTVKRDGEIENLTMFVYPVVEEYTDKNNLTKYNIFYMTGLESDEGEEPCTKPYVYNAWEGFCRSFEVAFGFAWVVLKSVWMLITFQVPITEIGGTITTISTIATTIETQSLSTILVFIPLIGANLAVLNLMPFPALDGSHVVFTTIEWIRGKPINRKIENLIHTIGICILFSFVVVVDILHFVL